MKAIIFGASNLGKKVYKNISNNYKVIAFCDNDLNKIGKIFCGLPIVSPNELKKTNAYIVIASMYHIEIARQILKMGIYKFGVYSISSSEKHKIINYNYEGKKFEEKNNKVSIISSGNSGSNSLALYRYIKNSEKLDVKYIDEENTDYYFDIFTSKVIIKSQDTSYLKDKINIQMWHGIPLKGINYTSKSKGVDKEKSHMIWNNSYIISYSQMYNVLIGACYGIDNKRFIISGMPRNDLLLTSNGKINLENIFPQIKGKKVIFYLPTFRNSNYGEVDGSQDAYIFNLKYIEKLNMYLQENNYFLIVKLHPFEENSYEEYLQKKHLNNMLLLKEHSLKINNLDLYEVLNAANILITDYSSVYFDFLLLNKPIIFVNTDLNEYSRLRGLMLEPYDYWTPGYKCNNIYDLIKYIELSIKEKDAFENKRNIIKSIMFKYYDENSCKRIEKFIVNKIEESNL